VAEGLANQEIAERLAISQHTVKNYMFRIFEKLGVSSRLELLLYVLSRAGHSREVLNQLRSSGSRNNADPESANTQSVGERKSVTGVKAVGSQMPAKMHEIRQMTGHGSV
jgi:hypothetical protein